MRIACIRAFALPFAFVGGGYRTSYGTRTHLNNLLIEIEVESGLVGYGEVTRLTGKTPEPTSSTVVDSLRALVTPIVGRDALSPEAVLAAMGTIPDGNSNIAAAVDTACWDLRARKAGMPLCDLIGGRRRDNVPCYHTVGQDKPGAMAHSARTAAAKRHKVLQMKVGESVEADCARVQAVLDSVPGDAVVLPDANGGWDIPHARDVIGNFNDARLIWEEPCKTYAENRTLAEATGTRLILDQCMKGLDEYRRICADGFAAGCGLKPAFQGGLTNSVIARDMCIEHGIALKIDDSWGADATTAASFQLALGVPGDLLLCGVDMRVYFDRRYADDGPIYRRPDMFPGDGPGLGITPDIAALGPALFEIR